MDWPHCQLDVTNAFLNNDIEEEVYIDIPTGIESPVTNNKVYKLKKSLYGLKRSPCAWFERFSKVLKKSRYKQSQVDHTLFFKKISTEKLVILIVYVDDVVLIDNSTEEMDKLKRLLAKEFEIKYLENLKYFLEMEVAKTNKEISVSQKKYMCA